MKKLQGTLTALVTPFTKDKTVDVESLKKLVRFQLENGISGIVPCGSTGEAATLDAEEYRKVIETVAGEVSGQIPVIAGATHNDTRRAMELAKIAKSAGADALLVAAPYYNKPTEAGLLAHYHAIATEVDLPIVLYTVPGRMGINVSAEMTLRLAQDVPNIVGVKEASADMKQIMQIIKNAPEDFTVLSGDDFMTLPIMAAGGDGVICTASNEIPAQFSALTQAALDGNWQKARKIHYEWLDLMQANFIETNPQPVKTALNLMGMAEEEFRLPLTVMEVANKQKLTQVLQDKKLI